MYRFCLVTCGIRRKQVHPLASDLSTSLNNKHQRVQKDQTCFACDQTMAGAREALRLDNGKPCHPDCFRCSACDRRIRAEYTISPKGELVCKACLNDKPLVLMGIAAAAREEAGSPSPADSDNTGCDRGGFLAQR